MHCVLLGLELAGISPETKLVLVRFVQLYGLWESITIGVKELAKASGATDRVVTSALSELVAEGFLIRTPIVCGRGRPKSGYRASSKLSSLLEDENHKLNVINRPKIDHVLNPSAENCKGGLSVCNRLLLSTLLLYADQFGVVRGIGVSRLSQATGLNRDRIKAQVHKLIALSIMRGVIPGVATSVVLGVSKSVYFINLHHDFFQKGSSGAIVLTFVSKSSGDSGEMSEVAAIIGSAQLGKGLEFERHKKYSGILPDSDRFNALAGLFSSLAKDRGSSRALQVRLEEYASGLLSKHWNALELGQFNSDDELQVRIKKDFRKGTGSGRDFKADGLRGELYFEFIYVVAVLMARRIQSLVLSVKGFSHEIAGLQILPSFEPGPYFGRFAVGRSLLIVPGNSFRAGECYVMNESNLGEPACERFSSEEELPEIDRYRFGLLFQVHTPTRYRYRG
ncbi:hypothetical protein CXB65_25585 [Pseudomonas monteilii]|uniref:Uncharacterized protein n=1 Tax=Pseudomonas monteilii TaxID=76759 RepID=A0A2N1IKK4_9PSED|nr:hypothetical protein CXB65_25585 [Pseudomonas monteilii]RPD95221.1 hypothetical protein EGN69_04300 [Pseudomonas monteilii]